MAGREAARDRAREAGRALLPALAAVLALARSAAAGPCLACTSGPFSYTLGFRADRPISPAGRLALAPRIDVAGTVVAVVWSDATAGDGDIVLAESDDGGCSFVSRVLSGGSDDDLRPDVAVSTGFPTQVVVFVRRGQVLAAASGDGGASFSAPAVIDPLAPSDAAAKPRVAAVPAGTESHVHVAWASGGVIRYAVSRDGGRSWQGRALALPGRVAWADPDVAADTRSVDPARESAVTIVASGALPASGARDVLVLRSNDSGATFYGDPTDPATLGVPRPVSDPAPPDPRRPAVAPAVDASDDGEGAFVNWTLTAWSDARGGAFQSRADARAEEGATPTLVSDWNDPPLAGDVSCADPARAAAVSLIPNPLDRPPRPVATVLSYVDVAAGVEAAVLRGELDASARPNLAVTCAAQQLTGVDPPRPGGALIEPSLAADEDLSDVYLVWADSRDGGSRVYFKRSDGVTAAPEPAAASPADCPGGGGLEVTWTPPPSPPHCDVARYHVEYGTQPGVYGASVDVAGAASTRLTGLTAGVRIYVRVSTVDEACNQAAASEVSAEAPDCTGVVLCPSPVGNTLRVVRDVRDARLAWDPPPAGAGHDPATSYDLYRSETRPGQGYTRFATATLPSARDFDAVPRGATTDRYFYRIVARNACGTSGDVPPP